MSVCSFVCECVRMCVRACVSTAEPESEGLLAPENHRRSSSMRVTSSSHRSSLRERSSDDCIIGTHLGMGTLPGRRGGGRGAEEGVEERVWRDSNRRMGGRKDMAACTYMTGRTTQLSCSLGWNPN